MEIVEKCISVMQCIVEGSLVDVNFEIPKGEYNLECDVLDTVIVCRKLCVT